eukprot:scaffold241_cov229-Prasinococcus_capsulatus_cf.AAC.12
MSDILIPLPIKESHVESLIRIVVSHSGTYRRGSSGVGRRSGDVAAGQPCDPSIHPSIHPSIRPSVRPSVRPSLHPLRSRTAVGMPSPPRAASAPGGVQGACGAALVRAIGVGRHSPRDVSATRRCVEAPSPARSCRRWHCRKAETVRWCAAGGLSVGKRPAAPATSSSRAMCAPESAADGPTAAAGKGPGATFTMKQVAQHCTPEDCWMVIDHQVYDVTSWVPKHPGGEIIAVKAGGDCTQLFKAYHPLYVQKMLGKFQIGSLKDSPEDLTTHTEFAAQSVFTATDGQEPAKAAVVADDEFYTTVKRRVESFFKETGLRRRDCPAMYIKSAIILAGVAGFYYLSFFHFTTFWVALLSSVVYGIFAGEVGVSIMHDANHGAYSRNSLLQQCMAFTLDIVRVRLSLCGAGPRCCSPC